MEYSFTQIIAFVGGSALCLLAVFAFSPLALSRATEALLDRIELGLARRAKRQAARADESIHVSIFGSYGQERAHR